MAGEECAAVSGRPKESCRTNKEKADSSGAAAAPAIFSAIAEGYDADEPPPEAKVKMLMSHEDIESIPRHKARGDSFKEFQARAGAKEAGETGEFEVSEEHVKNVQEVRAWIREEFSSVRSQYPHLAWED